jgi:hypothetical protein
MCGVRPTKRREGLAWRIPVPVLCCAWRREGDVLLLLLPLYVKLLLTLCSTHLSLASCFVRSCLAGYRTLAFFLRGYFYRHYTETTAIACHPSGLRRLRPKVSGWMEAQTMAGLGTSACPGGCSDTRVTVKSWCRRGLEASDLRWWKKTSRELTSWDAEHFPQSRSESETEQYHG